MNQKLVIGATLLALGASPATIQAKRSKEVARPNILFCIADDATFQHFGASGCQWVNTPNFDRFAREGLFMERCYTPNAKSSPSRACVLTGRNSWQLEDAANHQYIFPADIKVFTEVLSENGYAVASTGKGCAPCDPGMVDGKRRELTGQPYNELQKDKSTSQMNRVDYAANIDLFLSERSDDNPFFIWFGSSEPHRKYEFRSGIEKGGKSIDMIDEVPHFWPDTDSVRIDMLDYAFEIEEFDKQLGEVYEVIERHGHADDTIIIITSDNGMPFPRCKGNSYEYSNHMPFVVYWKGGIVNPGRRVEEYVSFVDIAPTVLDYAGVEWDDSGLRSSPGTSLRSIIEDRVSKRESKQRSFLLLGRERHDAGNPNGEGYPTRGLLRDDMIYLWNCKADRMPAGYRATGFCNVDGSPTKSFVLNQYRAGDMGYFDLAFGQRPEVELYNLAEDPYCINNLANDAKYQSIKASMRQELEARLIEQQDPRMVGDGDVFDQYPFMSSAVQDFYERVTNGTLTEPWKRSGWIQPTDYDQYVEIMKEKTE